MKKTWEHEPDFLGFELHSFPCFIARSDKGSFTGYVGVKNDHPLFGVYDEASDTKLRNIRVFGGVTYSSKDFPSAVAAYAGADTSSSGFWWFGFDFSHANCYMPYVSDSLNFVGPDSYRTVEEALTETMKLAEALQHIQEQQAAAPLT